MASWQEREKESSHCDSGIQGPILMKTRSQEISGSNRKATLVPSEHDSSMTQGPPPPSLTSKSRHPYSHCCTGDQASSTQTVGGHNHIQTMPCNPPVSSHCCPPVLRPLRSEIEKHFKELTLCKKKNVVGSHPLLQLYFIYKVASNI